MDSTVVASIIGVAGTIVSAFISWFLRGKQFPKSFAKRKEAAHSMFNDMVKANELAFLGISHSSLQKYFNKVINDAMVNGKTLPFEKIDIFFARDDVGRTWEQNRFGENVVEVVYKISCLFASESTMNILPFFKQLSFHQNKLVSYYGGSLFRLPSEKDDYFSVIYTVHYMPLPLPDADTKTSYTVRLTKKNKDPKNQYGKYLQSYKHIKNNSNLIFELDSKKNIWDSSVNDWDKFENDYPIYTSIMEHLIHFGEISIEHAILDLGCGTSRASTILADHVRNGSVLLLDYSPQMIKRAKEIVSDYNNVKFIVSDARAGEPLYGFARNKKFDRIFVHFSFQHFIDGSCPIQLFARKWKKYLKSDGEILLAVHNSFIECAPPEKFENWIDPLREELTIIANNMGITVKKDLRIKFTIADIKNGFAKAGFYLKEHKTKVYSRTMEDRITMWRTPAVMNSLLDIRNTSSEERSKLLDEAYYRIRGKVTMPTTVVFLRFSVQT